MDSRRHIDVTWSGSIVAYQSNMKGVLITLIEVKQIVSSVYVLPAQSSDTSLFSCFLPVFGAASTGFNYLQAANKLHFIANTSQWFTVQLL